MLGKHGTILLALCLCSALGPKLITAASPVKLSLSARNLPALDPFNGYPDPYEVVSYAFGSAGFKEIGNTSVLDNTQNPDWAEVVNVDDFVPGTSQQLRFHVWDSDLDGDDSIGSVEFFLAELSNAANGTLEKDIQGSGILIIRNVTNLTVA